MSAILDEQAVIAKFKRWLLYAVYLPDEIHKMIAIDATLHILPLGNLTYQYENKWSATIGILQEENGSI